MNLDKKIALIQQKIDYLEKKQHTFLAYIADLKKEIAQLKAEANYVEAPIVDVREHLNVRMGEGEDSKEKGSEEKGSFVEEMPMKEALHPTKPATKPREKLLKGSLEEFVGTNLINKIGILITVIGVAIGAKYSIDNNLINPLTRIILGYLAGIGLMGVAFKFSDKYENYSVALLGGGLAILYFITFMGYSLYSLFPEMVAFVLMVVFTIFAVVAAIFYDKQIIAHIGLVGAYAVPFLLSDGSGNVGALFAYMAIINVGILAISFKKYWKPLYYVSFGMTWLIMLSWFTNEYEVITDFSSSLTFSTIFFLTFYGIFLVYKLIEKEVFEKEDILLLLANSFVFYGLGLATLSSHTVGKEYLGLFTLLNAIIHFMVSVMIYRQQLADKNLFYLASGLVLVFITIAIPIQLDGQWVTLLWGGEAALLFWIGRSKQVPVYEQLSYPLILFAFISLVQDWLFLSGTDFKRTLFFNSNFLTSILVAASFAFITYLYHSKEFKNPIATRKLGKLIGFGVPALFLIALYGAFAFEIILYEEHLFRQSGVDGRWNYDLRKFGYLWLLHYTLFFLTVLSFVNLKRLRNKLLANVNMLLNLFVVLLVLTSGLYMCSQLRDNYLLQDGAGFYPKGYMHLLIRYILYAFLAGMVVAIYKYVKDGILKRNLNIHLSLFIHLVLLWVASSELLHWMNIQGSADSYKLGLTILWGAYSLMMIILGIKNKRKHFRIAGIGLFGVTLAKLFLYDIADFSTIGKTIVLVSLGVLLLVISFLYNKYKDDISTETEK